MPPSMLKEEQDSKSPHNWLSQGALGPGKDFKDLLNLKYTHTRGGGDDANVPFYFFFYKGHLKCYLPSLLYIKDILTKK